MTRKVHLSSALWVLLVGAVPCRAQVPVVGNGFRLAAAASVTSSAVEVVSGRYSIRGAATDLNSYTAFLATDPAIIPLAPNQTYTLTVAYRIVEAATNGFNFGFFSPTGRAAGRDLQNRAIRGAAGATGTETLTHTLGPYSDYNAVFVIGGRGTIVIDDIRITTGSGQLVASENLEGPAIVPGPLNFHITDAQMFYLGSNQAWVRSAVVHDIDGDAYPDLVVSTTDEHGRLEPRETMFFDVRSRISDISKRVFPDGVPKVNHSPATLFVDINEDGLEDMLFADSGLDNPPWTGSVIGVALNVGGGQFRDISSQVPAQVRSSRSYALAAGDLDGDGRVEILLPDQSGSNNAVLRWNGTGFTAQQNWIDQNFWRQQRLQSHTWILFADFDADRRQDLLVGGMLDTPNARLLFGSPGGFSPVDLVTLPDGRWGHSTDTAAPLRQGALGGPLLAADFNNDGLPDILAIEEQVLTYKPGVITDTQHPGYQDLLTNGGTTYAETAFRVFRNGGGRTFTETTATQTPVLGRRMYETLMPVDLNMDGFLDVVGTYLTRTYGTDRGNAWGTTLFMNDGDANFRAIDGSQLLPAPLSAAGGKTMQLGAFYPTLVEPGRIEAVIIECVNGWLKIYKVAANSSIGVLRTAR
jgi:hypothetical protein